MKPIVPPPVYFLLAIIAMAALHHWLPIRKIVPSPIDLMGLIPLAIGLLLGVWGSGLFLKKQTTLRPGQRSTALVTQGPFRFTRNPMYLGMVLGLIGLAILMGSLSPWLAIVPFVAVIRIRFIAMEEKMMEETFGEDYSQYKRRVGRWV